MLLIHGLHNLQKCYGAFKRLIYVGGLSKVTASPPPCSRCFVASSCDALHQDIAEGVQRATHEDFNLPTNSEIDYCIILDRDLDFVTPLVTPLTFEAFLEEQVGFTSGEWACLPPVSPPPLRHFPICVQATFTSSLRRSKIGKTVPCVACYAIALNAFAPMHLCLPGK